MFETKYSKFLTILLIVIIVAIIGLGGYLGYNYYRNYTIENDADKYVSNFVEEVANTTGNGSTTNTDISQGSISSNIAAAETGSNNSGKVQTYKGFNVLGTIEIPKTNIKSPILEGPASNNKIEVAVAVQYPLNTQLNTVGNIVISGHNYRNGTFFSNNKQLVNGDKIYITDLTGSKVEYRVYNTHIITPNDNSIYNKDTDGKREITLYSCTADLTGRLIVEARAD